MIEAKHFLHYEMDEEDSRIVGIQRMSSQVT